MSDDKVLAPFDAGVVVKWFTKYPKLETFIGAGTISLKAAREILEVDRYFMYDMYLEMLQAGAVTSSGSNGFRATKPLLEFLRERRKKDSQEV